MSCNFFKNKNNTNIASNFLFFLCVSEEHDPPTSNEQIHELE